MPVRFGGGLALEAFEPLLSANNAPALYVGMGNRSCGGTNGLESPRRGSRDGL